jgi:TetR/AcrR family transcriptional repressor of nem operon
MCYIFCTDQSTKTGILKQEEVSMGRTSDAKERIIESAMELFYARSAADVGVQEICDHAGVKKGSFYHFFDSKQDLILATLDTYWARGSEMVWKPSFDSSIPPLDRLREFTNRIYQMAHEDHQAGGVCKGCPMGNLAAEMGAQNDLIRQKIDSIFSNAIGMIKAALDDAVDQGDLPTINTEEAAQALWAYFEGAMLMAKSTQNPDYMKQLFDTGLNLLGQFKQKVVTN